MPIPFQERALREIQALTAELLGGEWPTARDLVTEADVDADRILVFDEWSGHVDTWWYFVTHDGRIGALQGLPRELHIRSLIPTTAWIGANAEHPRTAIRLSAAMRLLVEREAAPLDPVDALIIGVRQLTGRFRGDLPIDWTAARTSLPSELRTERAAFLIDLETIDPSLGVGMLAGLPRTIRASVVDQERWVRFDTVLSPMWVMRPWPGPNDPPTRVLTTWASDAREVRELTPEDASATYGDWAEAALRFLQQEQVSSPEA